MTYETKIAKMKRNVFNDRLTLIEDVSLAKHAYELCEKFIRSCEAANENNAHYNLNSINADTSLYENYNKDFDYYLVGLVLSMGQRQDSFDTYFELKDDKNKMAYRWLMQCAVYENYTMYLLECFRQTFVKKATSSPLYKKFSDIFLAMNWLGKQNRHLDCGKRVFKFFGHTKSPILVT